MVFLLLSMVGRTAKSTIRFLVAVSFMVMALPGFAAIEHREFASEDQRALYFQLIRELRCLVCQNQNLAESDADLAKDLRNKTYDLLVEGKDRSDVVDYMVTRYGDFVLYRPPFNLSTALLWLGPLALLMIGALVFWRITRHAQHTPPLLADSPPDENSRGIDINIARQLLDSSESQHDSSDGPPRQ